MSVQRIRGEYRVIAAGVIVYLASTFSDALAYVIDQEAAC